MSGVRAALQERVPSREQPASGCSVGFFTEQRKVVADVISSHE